MVNKKAPLKIIVKTTHRCNLECTYCMTESEAEKGYMDHKTLENMLRKIAQWNDGFKFTSLIWHGGEPLLLGLDFYKKAVDIQKTISNHKFNNSVQSNGLLLKDYVDFFVDNNFCIGMSLDGPRQIQNKMRPKKGGLASFEETLAMIKLAKEKEIGGGAICILNKYTAQHLSDIYSFFKKERIHHKVNVMLPAGRAANRPDLSLPVAEIGKCLTEYFDMWWNDASKPIIDVDPFTSIIYNLGASKNKRVMGDYPVGCQFTNDCGNTFISVVPGGNVYPCGRFSGIQGYRYRNINIDSMDSIMNSNPRNLLLKRNSEPVESCKKCEYVPICNSGCPENAHLFYGDIFREDGLCKANKMLFKHIENNLKKELSKANMK